MASTPAASGPGSNLVTEDVDWAALDRVVNLLRVRHARIQQLVLKWVPYSEKEIEDQKTKTAQPQKDDDKFLFRPERAGLGAESLAPEQADGSSLGSSASPGGGLENLRKQLLGKKTAAKSTSSKLNASKTRREVRKPGATHQVEAVDDDSGSEDGRSSAFKSKRALPVRTAAEQSPNNEDLLRDETHGAELSAEEADSQAPPSKGIPKTPQGENRKCSDSARHHASSSGNSVSRPGKRGQSFLDEVLSAKKSKKRKKQPKA